MNNQQQNPAVPAVPQQGPAIPPPQEQWEVTYHYADEPPEPEIWRSFASAFAFSQPNQDEEVEWRYTRRADIEARFAAGENNIRVAWSHPHPEQTYVVIRRL